MKCIITCLFLTGLLASVWGQCQPPPEIENAQLQQLYIMPSYPNLAKVFYSCNTGYQKHGGSDSIVCRTSVWEKPSLVCRRKNCGPLTNIANGYYEVIDTLFQSKATYYCNRGFRLVGNNQLTCTATGWKPKVPYCERTDCGPLPNIENGYLDLPDASLDAVATYSCNDGFSLIGSSRVTCTATGWDSEAPTCQRIVCESPKNIPNGYLEFASIGLGSVATYYCNRGFKMFGSNERRCTLTGWDTAAPTCERIFCTPPPAVKDVTVVGFPQSMYVYNDSIIYECSYGLYLEGEKIIQCIGNNTWSANPPQCVAKFCPANLPRIPNAFYVPRESYPVGLVVFYKCNTGFRLESSALPSYTSCMEDLTWSPFHIHCIRTSCGLPPAMVNGYYTTSSDYDIGSTAHYFCSTGYRLVGRNSIECRTIGWDSPAPTCERVTCQSPEIINAIELASRRRYSVWESVTLECRPGFTLKGNKRITCNELGNWQPEGVACIKTHEEPSDDSQAALCETVKQRKEFYQCGMNQSEWKSFLEIEKMFLEVRKLQMEIQGLEKNTVDEILDLILKNLKESRES
ncbi:complement receptor type 1-like [Protopterus annectens]|uniref:complement receptor type 1-like n=1 Tax=Protopterus annectens TaxID=7888 RepID=UPI001CFB8D6F|nr:complement receptor type 1-like [Protopterus annectens]